MKTCSAGQAPDERRQFMSECLKG
ncbi:PsiF family protein [Rhodocyclus purpureus]|nr:hypothetical protein [Rhodocyclus purpureus]